MTTRAHFDIVVAGGGLAGLTAAIAFANAGYETLCVDPRAPKVDEVGQGVDFRSTALLQPTRDFLADLGVWSPLERHTMPLETMRMMDASGATPSARVSKAFQSSDISDRPFGWNALNSAIRAALWTRAASLGNLTLRFETAVVGLHQQTNRALVALNDGTQVTTRLVVGADGRKSFVRETSGIGVKTRRFGQHASAFATTHPIPHENISTEIHLRGGPFTLVPLPDHGGEPSSAVVWMEDTAEIKRLADLPVTDFEAAASARSTHLLGPLKLITERTLWPIVSQTANRFAATRIALVAEAAHAMPPIGAQGFNTSVRDIISLLKHARAGSDPGTHDVLTKYERSRFLDVRARSAGVTLLNLVSQSGSKPIQMARAFGIEQLHGITPVRRTAMKLGLGSS